MTKADLRQKIIISLIVLTVVSIFATRPFMNRRDADKTVHKLLKAWENGDTLRAYAFFDEEEKAPPIFSLTSYKITQKSFDTEEGKRIARFNIILNFTSETILPSGQEWVFILKDSLGGWKVIDLYQLKQSGPEDRL